MAAGHHHAALRIEVLRSEVRHRRGHQTNVNDVRAAGANAVRQRLREFRAGEPAVAADDKRVAAMLLRQRTECLANGVDNRCGQRLADDAADVVGLEDVGR